jgi:peptidoglycan/LPS O-acetylase OafA/YrhL
MPNVLKDLLFGSTYHIYYYVFVAVIFVFATPLFRKIPLALWPGFAAFLVGASLISRGFGWGPDAASFISIITYLRNPFMFAGYFAIGWLGRLHYPLLRARIAADPYRPLLLAVIAVAICLLLFALPIATHAMFAAHWEYHYAVIALLFVAACHTQRSGKLVRFLSDSSYAIFLIHPAWITAADQLLGITKIEAAIPATLTRLTIGLFGAIGVMFSVQRLAPRLSRDLIGA